MNPLITVVIPTYNNGTTLGVAIESILKQTYTNLEIIIVNDFSTDDTRVVAEHYAAQDPRIKVIEGAKDPHRFDPKLNRNINAGWSARNAGLSIARGEYITFQDGDDASLLNRIEIQLALLHKWNATHLTTQCTSFDMQQLNTTVSVDIDLLSVHTGPKELYRVSQKSKGLAAKLSPTLNKAVPFHLKRLRVVNKLFFGTLDNWPGAGNSPLFRREVIDKVQFRPLGERVWPSYMGRGADRDFNFQVAETFKNSYYFDIPLYLWRTDK